MPESGPHTTQHAAQAAGQADPNAARNAAAQQENAKARIEAAKKDNDARVKLQTEQREKLAKSHPTPTQEENERAVLGDHIKEHEDDGSGPDPNDPLAVERAKKK